MPEFIELMADVAPFRVTEFRSQSEFDQYLRNAEVLRSIRWLYEQSLASPKDEVVLTGTCGLCLCEAHFTAPTRGGEVVVAGRVPNWRESLFCDCEHHLINRERALLHYLLDTQALQPWMRVLGLGDLRALRPLLAGLASEMTYLPGSLNRLLGQSTEMTRRGYHLVISAEQLDSRTTRPEVLSTLAGLVVQGGQLVFTAPFSVQLQTGEVAEAGPIGWPVLKALTQAGFAIAKACVYWSEEFGYLGPLNFIFVAAKGVYL